MSPIGRFERWPDVAIANETYERRTIRTDAERPLDRVWCAAPGENPFPVMQASQVMPGAHGRAIAALVVAAARAKFDVMIVEIPARAAGGHRAMPATMDAQPGHDIYDPR